MRGGSGASSGGSSGGSRGSGGRSAAATLTRNSRFEVESSGIKSKRPSVTETFGPKYHFNNKVDKGGAYNPEYTRGLVTAATPKETSPSMFLAFKPESPPEFKPGRSFQKPDKTSEVPGIFKKSLKDVNLDPSAKDSKKNRRSPKQSPRHLKDKLIPPESLIGPPDYKIPPIHEHLAKKISAGLKPNQRVLSGSEFRTLSDEIEDMTYTLGKAEPLPDEIEPVVQAATAKQKSKSKPHESIKLSGGQQNKLVKDTEMKFEEKEEDEEVEHQKPEGKTQLQDNLQPFTRDEDKIKARQEILAAEIEEQRKTNPNGQDSIDLREIAKKLPDNETTKSGILEREQTDGSILATQDSLLAYKTKVSTAKALEAVKVETGKNPAVDLNKNHLDLVKTEDVSRVVSEKGQPFYRSDVLRKVVSKVKRILRIDDNSAENSGSLPSMDTPVDQKSKQFKHDPNAIEVDRKVTQKEGRHLSVTEKGVEVIKKVVQIVVKKYKTIVKKEEGEKKEEEKQKKSGDNESKQKRTLPLENS